MKRILTNPKARISQGDIYRDVEFIEYAIEKKGIIAISKIIFPLVIVLTQDCDLTYDYNRRWSKTPASNDDKRLISIIVAPLYNAQHLYDGTHLSELGMQMSPIGGGTRKTKLEQNQTPRYHYLNFPRNIGNIQIVPSVIDFKHYFTVNVEYLKKHKAKHFVCRIGILYREDVSQRFSNYLSRIGLPET